MLVFNLTDVPKHYRGKEIPAHGSVDYSDLVHVPDRDMKLVDAKVLAFGSLPAWYLMNKEMKMAEAAAVLAAERAALLLSVTAPETENVVKSYPKKK